MPVGGFYLSGEARGRLRGARGAWLHLPPAARIVKAPERGRRFCLRQAGRPAPHPHDVHDVRPLLPADVANLPRLCRVANAVSSSFLFSPILRGQTCPTPLAPPKPLPLPPPPRHKSSS